MKTEKAISNVSSVLGIIAFVGTIASAFLGETIAAYILIGLTLLFWLIWLTAKVISLSNQVSKLKAPIRLFEDLPSLETKVNYPVITKKLENSLLITSARKNELKVKADFLRLHKCTIFIHVLVPEPGQSLRNAPHNKYIFGHKNGVIEKKDKDGNVKKTDTNVFALKYSMRNQWELVIVNGKGEELSSYLRIKDGLTPGWHQFMVAWDVMNTNIAFYIDCGSGGSDIRKIYPANWPDNPGEFLCVGAWPSSYEDSYVETRLANLWICEDYLEPDHPVVLEHSKAIRKIAGGN